MALRRGRIQGFEAPWDVQLTTSMHKTLRATHMNAGEASDVLAHDFLPASAASASTTNNNNMNMKVH
eukprot:3190407-Amphidinium_carterae.1